MPYEYADRSIRDMNRRNLRAFNKLKTLKFDELNVMRSVRAVYEKSAKLARQRYREIAIDSFYEAQILCGVGRKEAKALAEKTITYDWVDEYLEELDPVTQYEYEPEVERKIQRTAEAILSALDKSLAVDRALRLWTMQIAHYSIKAVDEATLEGYEAAGVERVMWNAESDGKVCEICNDMDRRTYPVDDVPDKPHYNCRCWITPV